MKIRIQYRMDKRIKVVEIRTGTRIFLTDLEIFMVETGIRDLDEHVGEALITPEVYKSLWEERVIYAEPHSFRFRRVKKTSGDKQET